jgi:hypothetical protein
MTMAHGKLAWRWLLAVYALLAAIVVLPLTLVEMPGLGDFPNHLARIHLLTQLPHAAWLQQYFEPHWQVAPYLGMDSIVALLSRVMSIYVAGRLFAGLCLVSPVLAAIALRWAVYRRLDLLPAAAFLISYSYVFSRGFLDYVFSANLAVIVFAAWIVCARRPRLWHVGAFALAAALLYLSHAFAFIAYGVLVAGFELGRTWPLRSVTWRQLAARWLAAAATALPALAIAAAFRQAITIGGANHTHYGTVAGKIGAFLSPFYFPGSAVTATLFAIIPFAAGVAVWRCRIVPELRGPILLTAIAAAAMPSVLFNLWGADFRLPVVLCVLVIAGLEPRHPLGRPQLAVLAACLLALVGLRTAGATKIMQRSDALAQNIREVVAGLPLGARLLVVQDDPADSDLARMVAHFGMLATIDRDAVVPFLFCYATPLRLRPDAPVPASPNAQAIDLQQLRDGVAPLTPGAAFPANGWGGIQYWRGWPARFDYVLIIHHGAPPASLPPMLAWVRGTALADLYRVAG